MKIKINKDIKNNILYYVGGNNFENDFCLKREENGCEECPIRKKDCWSAFHRFRQQIFILIAMPMREYLREKYS